MGHFYGVLVLFVRSSHGCQFGDFQRSRDLLTHHSLLMVRDLVSETLVFCSEQTRLISSEELISKIMFLCLSLS